MKRLFARFRLAAINSIYNETITGRTTSTNNFRKTQLNN
jgi:hypothetical protein